jgi:putative protein kinase ArgK-like GTPase of G3E family
VWQAIERFREHSAPSRAGRQRARQEYRLRELLAHRFLQHVERSLESGELDRLIDSIATRERDPYSVAASIIEKTLSAHAPTVSTPPPL